MRGKWDRSSVLEWWSEWVLVAVAERRAQPRDALRSAQLLDKELPTPGGAPSAADGRRQRSNPRFAVQAWRCPSVIGGGLGS